VTQFARRVPRPPLETAIDFIWLYRTTPRPHALERIMPTGVASLIVNLKEDQTRLYDAARPDRYVATSGTVLSGVQSRFQIIDTSEQEFVAGVVFKPGGTVPFLRVPAHETSDADVPLAALWSERRTSLLRERLLACRTPDAALDALEAALLDAWTPTTPHPAVVYALGAFGRAPLTTTITAVTDAIGLSAKRFIERFKVDVGLTPKRYCRIRRFQRALTHAYQGRDVDWTQVALDCGYFDQAHFIHDFHSFSGLTPTGYRSARTASQNHVKFLQSEADAI
jgi:AraC-like DNA-binding protein